jgi:2-dehydro-3-deoxy-D-gluconate 5-dehydrogenase
MRLADKVAIVTGSTQGIGEAIALRFAEEGAKVAVVASRDIAKASAVVDKMRASKGSGAPFAADLSDVRAIKALAAAVLEKFGRIDILVNNAGINIRKPPHVVSLAEWDSVITTNLTSAFLCSQTVHPAMKAAGGGKIINIGSMMSIFGASFAPAYAASKGGIVQFTRSCAVAWAADNIQVNAVLPGWIDTELTQRAREQVDGLHDKVLARTPAARWGEVTDFAGIAAFLASGAPDFVTGTAIPVDGGFSVMG